MRKIILVFFPWLLSGVTGEFGRLRFKDFCCCHSELDNVGSLLIVWVLDCFTILIGGTVLGGLYLVGFTDTVRLSNL